MKSQVQISVDNQKWDEAAVISTEIDTTKAPGLPSTTVKAAG